MGKPGTLWIGFPNQKVYIYIWHYIYISGIALRRKKKRMRWHSDVILREKNVDVIGIGKFSHIQLLNVYGI